MSTEGRHAMPATAQTIPTKRTYTDDLHGSDDRLFFGTDSHWPSRPGNRADLQLAVSWSGRQRSFEIAEFSAQEIVVIGFRVDDLDLCHHEASIDFCDGELLDEVTCRVVFRGFESAGIARLRIIADAHERMDFARFMAMLRSRIERGHGLYDAGVASDCCWL
jgi:hypothetical protein